MSPGVEVRGDRVRFVYRPADWGAAVDEGPVALIGSFTGWRPRLVEGGESVWPRAEVAVPGNSGEPEFRYVVAGRPRVCPEAWPRLGDNAVVPWGLRSPEDRRRADALARRLKTRLEDYDTPAQLANFRTVSGGTLAPGRLYRSYHPFVASRDTPVEAPRLAAAARSLDEAAIGAVINLTDTVGVLAEPRVPDRYAQLARRGDVLFALTSYEDAYYRPGEAPFVATLGSILAFVAQRRGPFLVHCRLGTDRTGVVTAVLATLAGVPWARVADDYEASNALGICEFRHRDLLAYAFGRLGAAPDRGPEALSAALVSRGIPLALVERAQAALVG